MSDSIPDLIAEAEHAATYPDVKPIRADLVERLVNALRESLSAPSGDDREALIGLHLVACPSVLDDGERVTRARSNEEAADAILAAGFRRLSPVTREEIAPCQYSGLSLVGDSARNAPDGPFLGRCECGAVLVIERGSFPWHFPGVGVRFNEWLTEHDTETRRAMAASIKMLHKAFGPSNLEENDYNSGAHEAIGQALDLFRPALGVPEEAEQEEERNE